MSLRGKFRYDADTHVYTVGPHRVPGISTVLKIGGAVTDKWFTQAGKNRGSDVHKVTHWLDLELISIEEVEGLARQWCIGWEAFKKEHKPRIRMREQPVVNKHLGFATILDVAGYLKGPMTLNIKTGAPADWHGIQRAGEVLAWKGERNLNVRRYTLYLRKTGKFTLVEHIYESDFDEFERCLKDWREQCHQKRLHGSLSLLKPLRSRRRLLSPRR